MFTGGKVGFESVFWFGVCGLVVCSCFLFWGGGGAWCCILGWMWGLGVCSAVEGFDFWCFLGWIVGLGVCTGVEVGGCVCVMWLGGV